MTASLGAVVLRLLVSLGVVLLLMALAARVLRRRAGGGGRAPRSAGSAVQVLARHQLARNGSVAVVRVADRTLVLGVTEAQVSVLAELPASAVAEPVTPRPGPAALTSTAGWPALLESLRDRTARR